MPNINITKNYNSDAAGSIVEALYEDLVSKEDQKLLELAFAQKIEQTALDEFLQEWDIEKKGESKSLLLSYVMKTNPQLQFPNYERPRLEGLLKYHRFHNLKLIAHYTKIVKALNTENIFPLILKGGAMKHLRPELSRAMGDIDILLSCEADFLKAGKISQDLGYVYEDFLGDHSIDLHPPGSKEGTVDIHQYIHLETDYDKSFINDLFARAKKEQTFGVQAFVPCAEDLLFLAMINLTRNLHNNTSISGVLYALFDFRYLAQKKNFDWNLVLQNIIKTKTYTQALLAMKFINKIIPETLPESLLKNNIINKKFTKYCHRVMLQRFYFLGLKAQCKNLKIKNSLKNMKGLKEYLAKKPKYFLLKRVVRKSHFLTKIFLMLNSENASS